MIWRPDGLIEHDLPRPKGLIAADEVADIGCGLRPAVGWFGERRHLCVEPHEPYCARLRAAGMEVVRATALEWLRSNKWTGAVLLLDVIEHMDGAEALDCVDAAIGRGASQVVIYTPLGFMEQSGSPDPWGAEFGGDSWQKHRSGWTERDFPGWRIEHYARSFFAIWTPTRS